MTGLTQSWVVASGDIAERATIADVAREAGVHKGTVSRALRGRSGVKPETRARIVATAEKLGFSASELASVLAGGESKTVGIVLPTLRSWYVIDVAAGASEALSRAGFRVELVDLDIDSDYLDVESELFRDLLVELGGGRGRAAVLLAGNISAGRASDDTATARLPAAATGLTLNSVPGLFVDHRAGGRLVAEHLLGLGHREVAVLDGRTLGKPNTDVWEDRTAGVREALGAAGLDLPDRSVVFAGDCFAEDGMRAMQTLLDSSRRLPTAVFCHSDEMAFGALAALRGAGLQCPKDISIAGFDDHPMSRYWGLTTVSQHAHQQGVRAALALIDALGGANGGAERPGPDVQVNLVVRETTGPPPASFTG